MSAGTSPNTIARALKLIAKYLAIFYAIGFTQWLLASTIEIKSKLSHSVSGVELTLFNGAETCQLQTKDESSDVIKTIPLLLEVPCYWVVSSETEKLLGYDYQSVGADSTFLIAGTPLDWSPEKKAYQKLPDNSYCSQYLQGIVISKNEVFAVDEKMLGAHCETGMAIDEKIFYAMAHNPARYQEKVIEKEIEVKKPTETPKPVEEDKSLLESVTDTIKSFFSGKTEDAK